MRKHLIGTILVLAALAACNKEIDTQTPAIVDPVEETPAGKVTLTFKATIGEETRTVYANDKTASWAAGDKISVCLTDSESYEVVDFTTEDGITFTGDVNPGYTTPVSAIYPANEVYTTYAWNSYFSQENGSVTAVRLADGYELGSADDPGKFIPLIGSYDGKKMEFHHFCSTMKVTLTNIPDDAAYFTFTTNKQKLVSDFSLTDGRMGLVSQEDDVDTSVYFEFEPGSLTTRSFYIPVPDGTLAANSFVTLSNADEVLFKKRITSSPTFGLNADEKDAIRVLPEVACWTRKDNWSASYSEKYNKTSKKVQSVITIDVESTDKYQYFLISKSGFISNYVSIADYLSSSRLETDISTRTTRTGDRDAAYAKQNAGVHVFVLYGIDEDGHFNGEYQIFELDVVDFSNGNWSMVITPVTHNSYTHTLKVTAPSSTATKYGRKWMLKSTYENDYGSDIGAFVWSQTTSSNALFEFGKSYYLNSTLSGESVMIVFGIDDSSGKRVPTYEYSIMDYTF